MSDTSQLRVTVDPNGETSSSVLSKDLEVVGNPLHAAGDELLDRYTNSVDDYLQYEARHSCGDYVLVDRRDGFRLITSFGYTGGYVLDTGENLHVATKLGTVLSDIDESDIRIDSDKLVYYLFMSPWFRLPFSTMFDGVSRVPPATVFEWAENDFDLRSYMSSDHPPASYGDVMDEVVAGLDGAEVIVSLSGGTDSTSLACACVDNDLAARAVTFDIGPGQTNDVTRGTRVAEELGIEHTVVPLDRPTAGSLADDLEASMKEDLFLLTNERIGFLALEGDGGTEVGISGMGPDPLAHRRMYPGPFRYDTAEYLNPKHLADEVFNRLGHRVLHTDFYLNHPVFRQLYLRLASRLYPRLNSLDGRVNRGLFGRENFDVLLDGSMESVLKGQISTEIPNVVWTVPDQLAVTQRKEGPALDVFHEASLFRDGYDTSFLDSEMGTFEELLRQDLDTIQNPIERLLFYAFCQNTQKSMSTLLGEDFVPLRGPICWGPSVSFFLNKTHKLVTRDTKKREISDYVDEQLGTSYDTLVEGIPERTWTEPKQSELVRRHGDKLSPANSTTLAMTAESDLLYRIYEDIHEMASENAIVNKQQNRFLNKVLNLELLLEETTSD